MSDNNFNANRRDILKGLSGAGASAVGLGLSATSAAGAVSDYIKPLDHSAAGKARSVAKRSRAYKTLRQTLKKKEGYKLQKNGSGDAYEVSHGDNHSFTGVVFTFDTKRDNVEVEIGIPLKDDAPMPAKAIVTTKASDSFPLQIDEFQLAESATLAAKREKEEARISSVDDRSIQNATNNIEVQGEDVIKHSNDLRDLRSQISNGGGGVSIAVDPIPPESSCPLDVMPCWACKDGVTVVNVTGCGVYTWLICGAISLPSGGMAGLGCATFVGLVCWAIHHYGISNPTAVCEMFCAC